ncbi:MAG TPA: NGG1p interacting factor NIF3 [Clostridia bacterium]|nr:NGG1p interacting factor NIF3 [Clostridia bacterium]
MKLKEIYRLAIEQGIKHDPRGQEKVMELLRKTNEEFRDLKEEEKADFDLERMENPYSDTRILCGNENLEVKRLLAGIDIEVGELLLAERLGGFDLVLAHHPEGKALAALDNVMHLQEDLLEKYGVPINVAESILSARITEVKRSLLPINHDKAVDTARLLKLAFMCVHTPADNLASSFLDNLFAEKKPQTVGDVVKILKKVPEYVHAQQLNAGPEVINGTKERRCGKIFVDMTGGTSGSEEAYEKLSQAGVGTVVGMHMSEKHRKKAEKAHINVVIAGHIASDSLGMNLFLDQLEERGIQIETCSGLYRVKRNSAKA